MNGAGGRDEGRGVAGSGQRLHKGPSVCPSCPHTDINKMCIYLFIYIPAGWGRGWGGGLSVPEGPRLELREQEGEASMMRSSLRAQTWKATQ